MADYYLTPEVMPAIRQQIRQELLFTGALALFSGFCYCYFILQADAAVALSSCVMLLGAVVFAYFYNVRQQQALAAAYRLRVTPTGITRTQAPLPTIALAPAEITSITQNAAGVLTIATADPRRAVYVPVHLNDRAELLRELAAHAPLTTLAQQTLAERLTPYAGLVMLGLMAIFYSVINKVLSTITGGLILGALAWSGWHSWRNPNLPPQARRLRWFLPLVFLAILGGLLARLLA